VHHPLAAATGKPETQRFKQGRSKMEKAATFQSLYKVEYEIRAEDEKPLLDPLQVQGKTQAGYFMSKGLEGSAYLLHFQCSVQLVLGRVFGKLVRYYQDMHEI